MSFGTPESHGFCLPPPRLPDTGGPMQQLIAVPGGGAHLRTAGGRGVEAGRGQAEAPSSAAEPRTLWTRRNSCAERPGEARPLSAFQRGGRTETEQLAAGFRATERARPGPRALHPGDPSWAARGRGPPCGHQQGDWWGPGWVQPSEPSPARWKTRDLQAGDATIGVRPAGDSLEPWPLAARRGR